MSTSSAAGSRPMPQGGFELFAWFFMRVSGILLVFLALGHLTVMHIIHNVDTVDYAFVAQRFSTPFWRSYDCLMLILALLHGFNGARTLVDDYAKGPWRILILAVLGVLAFVLLVVGALVILTFQPQMAPIP